VDVTEPARKMTEAEISELRREIGAGVMNAQDKFKHLPPIEVVPEVLSALLSLAAYVAYENCKLSLAHFRQAFEVAVKERWRL